MRDLIDVSTNQLKSSRLHLYSKMEGIDRLLVNSLSESIRSELTDEKVSRLEKKIAEDFGLGFDEFVYKFGQVRKSLFAFELELKKIEDNILRNFVTLEKHGDETWLVVKNDHLTEVLLKTFADEDKKHILDATREKAESIPRVLTQCGIPNTSGYRKMNQMIDEGFVVPVGLAETFEGKRAILYKSVIQKIHINIDKNDIVTKILVPEEIITSSPLVQLMTERTCGAKNRLAN